MQIYVHYLGHSIECKVLEKGLQVKHKNQDSKKSNSVTFSVTYFVMSFIQWILIASTSSLEKGHMQGVSVQRYTNLNKAYV